MKIKSLGLKISLLVALMIAIIIVIVVYIVDLETNLLVDDLVTTQSETVNNVLIQSIDNFEDEALKIAEIIARSPYVVDAMEANDPDALRAAILLYFNDVDMITVCDSNGIVLARAHSDDIGDNVSYLKAMSAALSSGNGISIIEDTVFGLATQGSAAILNTDGELIGAVTTGHALSRDVYVDEVQEMSGAEVTIFDGDTRISTTITDDSGNRVVGTQIGANIADIVLNQGHRHTARIELFGGRYAATYSPLVSDGQVIGILFTGIHIEHILSDMASKVNLIITVSVIAGVAAAVLIFVFCIFLISKPLKKIGKFADKIKTGELGISQSSESTIAVRSKDEVGMLARNLETAYTQLKGYISEIQEKMNLLANGDLSSESTYDFQGDFTLIKDAINGIISNLNLTMSEINTSTSQVASGAKQIADGAQSLAQGSTEQAASVQQLSSSISEIAQKTKENADKANRAATLANTIMNNAQKGSDQMSAMTAAVREINEASQSISKVIKVIDDIAFQTNILALNAAVEAARAGQHGKGFAVVAEEVRNLAGKSAEAAKDTGSLIANSMEKAELGARIADETAASLSDIVSGINESTQIVSDIAESSEEQSLGIGQINQGIDQVAQVVQQNSATAQQSAAASEEMSGQSTVLEQLIAQFKLKNSPIENRALPPAETHHYDNY